MTYAISDLHGCREPFLEMLDLIGFSESDTLYVLGDVMDRGPEPFKILLDIAEYPNIRGLLGNHDLVALDALPALERLVRKESLSDAECTDLGMWIQEGGESSIRNYTFLSPDERDRAVRTLEAFSLWEEIELGSRAILMTHSGLGHFSADKPIDAYAVDDLVWCRPTPATTYYADKYVVFGHTPTRVLWAASADDPSCSRIFKTETWADIDCGCVYAGGLLGCLCLDTMEEFYVDPRDASDESRTPT